MINLVEPSNEDVLHFKFKLNQLSGLEISQKLSRNLCIQWANCVVVRHFRAQFPKL